MGALPSGGVMAAVFANGDIVRDTLTAHPAVSIAAFNGPAEHGDFDLTLPCKPRSHSSPRKE